MSRLAVGDEELEDVLGSECTEAVLQLLYIQMVAKNLLEIYITYAENLDAVGMAGIPLPSTIGCF